MSSSHPHMQVARDSNYDWPIIHLKSLGPAESFAAKQFCFCFFLLNLKNVEKKEKKIGFGLSQLKTDLCKNVDVTGSHLCFVLVQEIRHLAILPDLLNCFWPEPFSYLVGLLCVFSQYFFFFFKTKSCRKITFS